MSFAGIQKFQALTEHSERKWCPDRAGPGSVLRVHAFSYPRHSELPLHEAHVPSSGESMARLGVIDVVTFLLHLTSFRAT
jgi:hypothetical protein